MSEQGGDADKVVRLVFSSPGVTPESIDFLACKNCKNKTYTLTYEAGSRYPTCKCAACGQHLGRMGWVEKD